MMSLLPMFVSFETDIGSSLNKEAVQKNNLEVFHNGFLL